MGGAAAEGAADEGMAAVASGPADATAVADPREQPPLPESISNRATTHNLVDEETWRSLAARQQGMTAWTLAERAASGAKELAERGTG